MTKRILILMSKTGGGHRASAEALRAGFAQLYGDAFHIDIIDLLMDYLPWPLREAPKSYGFMSAKAPWLWRLLFEATDEAMTTKALDSTAARALSRSVERAFVEYQPDLVISVHPLAQHVSLRALRRSRLSTPFVTVITDLATMHPAWFHPGVTLCFVPTEEARQMARKHKLSDQQIRLCGLPLRPAFTALPERGPALRTRLKMDAELLAVLVYGGGESASKVTAIINALDQELHKGASPRGQMVVVCGREGKLQPALAARQWSVPLRSLGYVDNMHEWMAACDCIVTKAGPGAISEALVCGLPIVLSGFIPGQEAGNVPYVINHGVGIYSDQPQQIASTVAYWFGSGRRQMEEMSAKAIELSNPHATFEIVAEIAGLLDAGSSGEHSAF
jgi:1,2-diacylglycerol 3-beta-galactosyltransferase